MIRLFVGIALPKPQGDRLASLCIGVKGARWVDQQNFHITLRFIGDVQEPGVEEIIGELTRIDWTPFFVTLSGVGHFGSRKKVRALWAGVQSDPHLFDLHSKIEAALIKCDIKSEGKRFIPHVTLARLKNVQPKYTKDWILRHNLFCVDKFLAEEITLFESHRTNAGSIYIPLCIFPGREFNV